MVDMTNNLIKPIRVLDAIKVKNPNCHITIKQIYNVPSKIRSGLRQSSMEVQYLMNLLQRDRYVH